MGRYPRALRRTPLLRGPGVAFARLFEPGVSSCPPLVREDQKVDWQVSRAVGGVPCPQPETHSRHQLRWRQLRLLRIPPRPKLSARSLAARTPRVDINEAKCSQCGQRRPRKNWTRGGPVEQQGGERLYFLLCPVGPGAGGWGESGGNRVVKDQEVVGLYLLPSNAPRHPTLGYLWPSSWPRQVAAMRNPW